MKKKLFSAIFNSFNQVVLIMISIVAFACSCNNPFHSQAINACPVDPGNFNIFEGDKIDIEKLKNAMTRWEKRGDYENSYKLLEMALKSSYSQELQQYALDHASMHLDQLERENYSHSKSVFLRRDRYGRKLNKKTARNISFPLIYKEYARYIANQYDLCKNNLKFCQAAFQNHLQADISEEDMLNNEKFWDRSKAIQKRLINARSTFISYGVISPYLAETQKWLFIAEGEWYRLWIPHSDELYEAVDFIAAPAHKTWLYQSNKETREQFIMTWRRMKELSSKREWEEFQAIVSLSESIDESKGVGANAWWTK